MIDVKFGWGSKHLLSRRAGWTSQACEDSACFQQVVVMFSKSQWQVCESRAYFLSTMPANHPSYWLLCVYLIVSSKKHLSLRIMHKHIYHPCNICCPEASKEDISPWTSVPVFTSMWSLLLQHLFALVVLVFVCFVNACSVILYLCCRSSDKRFNAAH